MRPLQKAFQISLSEAEHQLQSTHRLVNTLYPQLRDSRILLNALQQAYKAAITLISTALKIEHIQKKIRLSKNPEKNIEIFFKKCAERYGLEKIEAQMLRQLLITGENYQKSGCTFPQHGKAIILNDEGTFSEVSPVTLKNGINALQRFIKALRTILETPRKI